MATFVATTTCNSPRLKDPEAARRVLDRYLWDGELTALIRVDGLSHESHLEIYGYDWPGAWQIPDGVDKDDFEPDFDIHSFDGFEAFLKEIAPCLAEALTIQAIGAENCRWPLSAAEWHVPPDAAEIEVSGFKYPPDDTPPEASLPAASVTSATILS